MHYKCHRQLLVHLVINSMQFNETDSSPIPETDLKTHIV